MKKLSIILIIGTLFSACKKEDKKYIELKDDNQPLISEVRIDGKLGNKYYFENNKIIKRESYDKDSLKQTSNFIYSNNRIEKIETILKYPFTEEYQYDDNGKVIKRIEFDDNNELEEYDCYFYEHDRLTNRKVYRADSVLKRDHYFEYDANGNNTKRIEYSLNIDTIPNILKYSSTTYMQFDNMNSPFRNIPSFIALQNFYFNNPTYYQIVFDDSSTYTIERSFEYNELGYPIKDVSVWLESGDTTIREYFYK